MNGQAATTAHITGAAIVLLVADLQASSDFYRRLGFTYEEIGGPDVSHVHVSRGSLTFILHPAKRRADVRPASALEGGLYFDAYAYTDAVDLLAEQCRALGVEIVNGPHYSEHWSEFTMRDIDGYRITFGGGVSTASG
ncbi:VOC family protein [Paenibacillus lycopersici]|uniref:VOC family protein n=2 Tax=Paenibacillus lycopersici TaxID=2704462 RepID=A0A6C0G7Q2_9BACL|nr:VOC family protein [Paenibacillus lycopersici]